MDTALGSDFKTSLQNVSDGIEDITNGDHQFQNDQIDVVNIISKLYGGRHLEAINRNSATSGESLPQSLIDARKHLDLVLNIFKNLGNDEIEPKKKILLIMTIAKTCETIAYYPQAIENYQAVCALAQAEADMSNAAEAQLALARLYALKAHWELAKAFLENCREIYEEIKDTSGKLRTKLELGKTYYRRGKYLDARDTFVDGLRLAKSISDCQNTAELSNNLGVICSILEDHYCGLMHLKDSLVLYQNIKDVRGVAEVYNNIGKIYTQLKDYRSASDSFEKALRICNENGFIHLIAFVYLNKANFYLDVGDLSLASQFNTRALEILVKVEDPIALAKTNRLFGHIFWQAKNYDLAPIFFEESLSLYNKFGISLGAAICHTDYAFMFHDAGNNEQAFSHIQAAKNIYRDLGLEKHLSMLDEKISPMKFPEGYASRNFTVIQGSLGNSL